MHISQRKKLKNQKVNKNKRKSHFSSRIPGIQKTKVNLANIKKQILKRCFVKALYRIKSKLEIQNKITA